MSKGWRGIGSCSIFPWFSGSSVLCFTQASQTEIHRATSRFIPVQKHRSRSLLYVFCIPRDRRVHPYVPRLRLPRPSIVEYTAAARSSCCALEGLSLSYILCPPNLERTANPSQGFSLVTPFW